MPGKRRVSAKDFVAFALLVYLNSSPVLSLQRMQKQRACKESCVDYSLPSALGIPSFTVNITEDWHLYVVETEFIISINSVSFGYFIRKCSIYIFDLLKSTSF